MSELFIGDVCSRLREITKTVRQDSFVTDRYLYSLFMKHAALVIKRLDEKKSIMSMNSVFETLDYVELEECDKIEAGCMGIKSYATFRRTKQPIPVFMEGKWGPMLRSVTSLDGSIILKQTTHDQYQILSNSKNFRYNTTKYVWPLNDRFYFPNIDWPAVRMEGIFNGDISMYKCNYDTRCQPRQKQSLNVPDYILADVEAQVMKDLAFSLQIPSDSAHDNINPNR